MVAMENNIAKPKNKKGNHQTTFLSPSDMTAKNNSKHTNMIPKILNNIVTNI